MEDRPASIKEMNETIVKFMGYIHYCIADIDYSECGGLYTRVGIYSKFPVKIEAYPEDDQYYLDDSEDKKLNDEERIERWKFEQETRIYIQLDGWYSDLPKNLQYHESWDALMPVIDKIESTFDKAGFRPRVTIDTRHVRICDNPDVDVFIPDGESKLEATHLAVYKFIIQHNERELRESKESLS